MPRRSVTGWRMFKKELIERNKEEVHGRKDMNRYAMELWEQMSNEEKAKYQGKALEGYRKRRKETTVPFYTRCSPSKFSEVAAFIKENPRLKERVEKIGFGKLLNIEMKHLPRDLCSTLIGAYDPPTKLIAIRGKMHKIKAQDVEKLLGVRCKGKRVKVDGDQEGVDVLKRKYGSMAYTKIKEKIISEEEDDMFEFHFVLYALGTLLSSLNIGKILLSYEMIYNDKR